MVTHTTHNATPRDEWFKSSLAAEDGSAVWVRFPSSGGVQVRGGEDGPVLTYTDDEWRDFLAGARLGEFNDFGVSAPGTP
jgi:hypothetical protein